MFCSQKPLAESGLHKAWAPRAKPRRRRRLRKRRTGRLIGLQCKNTWSGVTEGTVADEVKKADDFKPALAKLYIATTAATDKTVQAFVRSLSDKRKAAGLFEVEILFWNDVWHDLALEEERVYQHFPHLRPRSSIERQDPLHDQRLFHPSLTLVRHISPFFALSAQ
jgi:hypothetical protein